MFRPLKNPSETIQFLFTVSDQYIDENTPCSLLAAYKILRTIYDNYPDKAVKGQIGVVKSKLKEIGFLNLISEDTKKESNELRPRL